MKQKIESDIEMEVSPSSFCSSFISNNILLPCTHFHTRHAL